MNSFSAFPRYAILALILVINFSEAALSPQEIIKRADQARYPEGQFSFFVKVTDKDEFSDSKETVYLVHTKDTNNSLVETKAPERMRGRKLLMKQHDLWMFLPNLKKPTRVGFEQRLTGEVSNGDLARTNFSTDYKAKLISEETIEGKTCYKLLLTATHKEVAYRRIVYWVSKTDFVPVQVNFYALSGKLLKSGKYSNVKPVLNKNRVTQLVITDALKGKKQSVLNYFNFKKASYDDSFFSKESLSD
ncbi:MAG: outer membrane lipoprotein-sorting protein [Deltaproteobacteria bacterium]|nr:outer membrane lipoprotein-sorting protein [Deltaproteobacteria bacterium]